MGTVVKRLWRWLAGTLAAVAILAALAIGAFRLALDLLPEYEVRIADEIRMATGLQLAFESLDARLGRYGPEVYFEGATIRSPDGSDVLISARAGRASLAPLRSLLYRRLEIGRVVLEQPLLNLVIFPDRHIELVGQDWLAGTRERPDSAAGLERLPRGVFEVRGATLSFVDLRAERAAWQLSDVDLELERSGDQVSLAGRVRLPPQLGGDVDFDADVAGPLQQFEGLSWRARVAGSAVDLAGWSDLLPESFQLPTTGRGEFRVSGRGVGPQLQSSRVVLALDDVTLPATAAGQGVVYRRIAGDLRIEREGERWQARGSGLELSLLDSSWKPTDLDAVVTMVDGRPAVAALEAGYLRIENLLPFAAFAPDTPAWQRLRELRPRGVLEQIRMTAALRGTGEQPDVTGRLRFSEVGFAPTGGAPGLAGLRGEVEATGSSGEIELAAAGVAFDWPGQFRRVLDFPVVSARVGWSRFLDGVRVWADDIKLDAGHGRATGTARVLVRPGESPLLNIDARVQIDDLSQASRYYPIARIKPKPLKWLDEAFRAGRITEGTLQLVGPARGFPYRDGEGYFHARARAEGITLSFAPDWMPATGLVVSADFDGPGMKALVDAGAIGGVQIERAQVEISDWRDAPLLVTGRAKGDAGAVHEVLANSSLRQALGAVFADVRASGPIDGDVVLVLPLTRLADRMVTVNATAAGVELSLQGMQAAVRDVRGQVWVRNREIYAPALNARFLGGPLRVAIDTRPGRGDELVTSVDASGTLDAAQLPRVARLPLDSGLAGMAAWRGSWLATRRPEPGAVVQSRIRLDSDLVGVTSGLPAPFAKAAADTRPLSAELTIERRDALLARVSLGTDLRAIAEFDKDEQGFRMARALVRAGGGPATALPVGPGLVIEGSTPYLSISDLTGMRWETPSSRRFEDILARASLQVGRLEVLGYEIADLDGRLRPGNRAWDIEVSSPAAAGRLRVPYALVGDVPLVADLSRLRVAPAVRERGDGADPRRLPAMQLDIRDLTFLDWELGHLTARLERADDGLTLERFKVEHPAYGASGAGGWLAPGGEQTTSLRFELEASDVLGMLRALKLAPVMEANSGTLSADVSWPGGPDARVLERISGSVKLAMRDGRMLSVEPGAGRVLGLLSLGSLPKRLALDFDDLTGQGLAFNSVKGTFTLASGDAYTDDLTLRGPAAEIGVAGKTSLGARTYDQTAVVTGDLGASLGVAGALAGGPAVGAALLLFSQIFKEPLKGVARGYYRITGPWDDPQVRKVEAREIEEAAGLAQPPAPPAAGPS